MKRNFTFIISLFVFTLISNSLLAGNCPPEYNPVCGANGVSYINPCYAEAAGVHEYTFGVCWSECIDPQKINPDANCYDVYEPVCGCNEVTYKNECEAEAAGVQNYTPGKCPDQSDPNYSRCYDPLLIFKSHGVRINIVSGALTLECTEEYDPVCGCDGLTYANSCMAEASGIKTYTPGSCSTACIDPEKIDPDAICVTAFEPVCGCNDVTYPNECAAEAAGVTSYTPGQCGSSSWCDAAVPLQCGDFKPTETTIGETNNITKYPGCSSKTFDAPEKVYVINKTTAGDLQIGLEITTPGMDLDLFLLKGDCDEVVCLKSSKTSNTSTNNEGIIYENAPIGTYYIVVDGQYATSVGDFRLEVSCGILDCSYTQELKCGVPFQYNNKHGQDNVSLYKCGNVLNVENNGPEVVHTFSIPTAGPVDIYLSGLSANLELFLLQDCDRGDCLKYSQKSGKKSEHISTYLEAGTYYVVVDGYNGATSDYTLRVDCPSVCDLELWVEADPSDCGKNNGKLIVESSGGTPGYIVSWDGPVKGSFYTQADVCTISNLPPGTYWVKKTDKNGCSDKKKVTIYDNESNIDLDVTPNDASCGGMGSLRVRIHDGKAPFKVSVYGPKNKTISTYYSSFLVDKLPPGKYTIYVKDANGCTDTEEAIIEQNNGYFYFSTDPKAAHCETPGSIAVKTYEGVPPYNIHVEGPVSGTAKTNANNFTIRNLPGGTYKITIEDGNWCSHTEVVVVPDENMTIHAEATNGICGKDGSIQVDIENGKPNYKIVWEGPVDGEATVSNDSYTIPNLPSGTYKINVMDGNWCSDYAIVKVDNSDYSLDIDVRPIDGICEKGALWIDINNGTSPYKITWSGPQDGTDYTNDNGYDIPHLPSGTYSVLVEDANGCSAYKIVDLENHFGPDIHLSSTKVTCDALGSITVNISGGKPDFHIKWEGPVDGMKSTSNNSFTVDDLPAGDYKISVHDDYSCKTVKYIEVKKDLGNIYVDTHSYPEVCDVKGSIKVSASGGKAPYRITLSGNGENRVINNDADGEYTFTDLSAGNYKILVQDKNWCEKEVHEIVKDESNQIYVDTKPTHVQCDVKGSIKVTASGGKAPYRIMITGNGVNETVNDSDGEHVFNDLAPGNYTIKVQDKNWCEKSVDEKVLDKSDQIYVDTHPTHAQCDVKGAIKVTATGGKAPYRITITGNGVNETKENDDDGMHLFDGLQPGTYTIKVQDKKLV